VVFRQRRQAEPFRQEPETERHRDHPLKKENQRGGFLRQEIRQCAAERPRDGSGDDHGKAAEAGAADIGTEFVQGRFIQIHPRSLRLVRVRGKRFGFSGANRWISGRFSI
jgi:hypothetical protein